jgi:serine/threonine-protein kinase SRK2
VHPPVCRPQVDVWASGVLLFVLLLGMFPFEMEDENYVNTAGEGLTEV